MNPQKNNPILKEMLRAGDCPGTDLLETYRTNPETAASVVKSHLASCPACQAELELLVSFQMASETATESADVDWMRIRLRLRVKRDDACRGQLVRSWGGVL